MDLKETTDKVIKYKLKYSAQELEDKLDKVDQEYSLEEKEKLNGLKNYDDSQIKSDVNTLTENKLDKNQGTENSGKVLGTNANGEVIPLNGYGFEYDEETKMLKYGTDPTSNLNQGISLDDTLSKRGYAADAGAVGKLKEDLSDMLSGSETSAIAHYDETFSGQIAGNVYKSGTIAIPKGNTIKSVRFYSRSATPSTQGYMYMLDSEDTIVDKIEITPSQAGWNELAIGKSYSVDVYIALSGETVGLSYSNTSKTNYYSNGLFEAQSSERTKGVGETISFAHNVEGRYYEFGFEITYGYDGINNQFNDVNNRIDEKEDASIINPSNYIMPLVVKTEGSYTLIGRWFDHMLDTDRFKNCCNCGGQSIMFKVKGATTITANFGQVSRYPDNPNYLMENEPYMAYSVDGSSFIRVQLDTTDGNTIIVPDTNEHFVWIVIDGMDMVTKNGTNRDSGWIGVYIKSITTNGTMYAVEPKNKQILFVGDSMVEGINTLGTDSKAPSNSAVNEFSFKTAQRLNAIPLLNGYGGTTTWSGVNWVRYSFGTTDTNVTTMEPDLIVIEYGHNDNTLINNGTYTVAQFIAKYEELISILRGMYTGTPIFCVVPFHQYLVEAVTEVVESTDCCYLIETADYDATYSDGTHPNASGATAIAEKMSADIINVMGKEYFI